MVYTSQHKKIGNIAIRAMKDNQKIEDIAKWLNTDVGTLKKYVLFCKINKHVKITTENKMWFVTSNNSRDGFYYSKEACPYLSVLRDRVTNEMMQLTDELNLSDFSDFEEIFLPWRRREHDARIKEDRNEN